MVNYVKTPEKYRIQKMMYNTVNLAFTMPGIQDIDIEACRRLSLTGDHPTESLLRIWGSKGYTILDLYKIFFRSKLLRCMQILLPYG